MTPSCGTSGSGPCSRAERPGAHGFVGATPSAHSRRLFTCSGDIRAIAETKPRKRHGERVHQPSRDTEDGVARRVCDHVALLVICELSDLRKHVCDADLVTL
eukprot:2966305-Prymnesium_polylepis.1